MISRRIFADGSVSASLNFTTEALCKYNMQVEQVDMTEVRFFSLSRDFFLSISRDTLKSGLRPFVHQRLVPRPIRPRVGHRVQRERRRPGAGGEDGHRAAGGQKREGQEQHKAVKMFCKIVC